MNQKIPISIFIEELEAALQRHDGYINGAKGQNPKTGSLDLSITKEDKDWQLTGKYYTQYNTGYSAAQKKQALYWREHATRVWDSEGLAKGIYELKTGIKTDNNCYEWCTPKSIDINKLEKAPGVVVFRHNYSIGRIVHTGYLWKPININNPEGDWWVIEAKGVTYGVIQTRLSSGEWNCWGKMIKYYDYTKTHNQQQTNEKILYIQQLLASTGIQLPDNGLNGVFGPETEQAIMDFQIKNQLPVTGTMNDITSALLKTQQQHVLITHKSCIIRTGPGLAYKQIDIAHEGDMFLYGGKTHNHWHSIIYDNTNIYYVIDKYSSIIPIDIYKKF